MDKVYANSVSPGAYSNLNVMVLSVCRSHGLNIPDCAVKHSCFILNSLTEVEWIAVMQVHWDWFILCWGRGLSVHMYFALAGWEDGVWFATPIWSSTSTVMLLLPNNWTEDQCCRGDGGGCVRRNQSWSVLKAEKCQSPLKGRETVFRQQ